MAWRGLIKWRKIVVGILEGLQRDGTILIPAELVNKAGKDKIGTYSKAVR